MKNSLFILILFTSIGFMSCTKDGYKNDGGPSNPKVNMTTYDYLKSNRLFDSLVKVIDRAGLKDVINGDVTLFASTNYSAVPYVEYKKFRRDLAIGNENLPFSIDSIPAVELSDSMKMYIFPGKINREQMTVAGQLYDGLGGAVPDIKYMIKLRRTQDYSGYVDHVDYVTFTKVIKTRDDKELDPSLIPDTEKDKDITCQTSGIITTTGIVHVLGNTRRLFFNEGFYQ